MKQTKLEWTSVGRDELTAHLETREVLRAEALGEALLYQCRDTEGETLALALPGDLGLIIRPRRPRAPNLERRKATPPGHGSASKD